MADNTPFHIEDESGETETVHRLFEAGHEVLPFRQYLYPSLDFEQVYGDDINASDKIYGNTLLHLMAENESPEMVRILIDAGADINATNKYKETPLLLATENNDSDMARILVEAGADINAASNLGATPLHYAACKCNTEIAHILIDAGADVNIADGKGIMPLHIAANFGRQTVEIVRKLLEAGADVNASGKDGTTPFHMVAYTDNIETARFLLDAGADMNVARLDGSTPFHIVAQSGETEMARFLLDAGADINATDKDGETPLHIAAKSGDTKIARILLEGGADINVSNENGVTPFHIVAELDNIEIACLLLDAGVDINGKCASIFDKVTNSCNILYLKHVVKLKCLGLHVSEKNMSYLRRSFDEELRMFEKQCETEVASMKGQEIQESYRFSLYDVLTMREHQLKIVLQVEEMRLKVEKVVRGGLQPVYGNMICIKFARIVRTVKYSVKARKIIGFIVNSVQSIPEECVDKIASYFTNKDMKDLAYSFK